MIRLSFFSKKKSLKKSPAIIQKCCVLLIRSFTDYYVDILFALNKKYFDNLRQWLMEMVATDNFPTANVSKEQKQQFATFVLKERTNKRKLLEVTREFSLACCGLVGTEYAMQMGQVMAVWDRIGMKEEDMAEAKAATGAGGQSG